MKNLAQTVVEQHRTNCPLTIAKEMGIIISFVLLSISGFWNRYKGEDFFYISSSLDRNALAFTVAYLLGHVLLANLQHTLPHNAPNFPDDDRTVDEKADEFARLLVNWTK